MKTTTQNQGDVLVIYLHGKIMGEEPGTTEFHDTITSAIVEGKRKVVVDFANVDWLNSSGLGMLVKSYGILKEVDGQMRLSGMNEPVTEVMVSTRLDLVFEIHQSVQSAIASF